MLSMRQIAKQESAAYAVDADFCRIFEKEMDRLYLLSFLLTAEHAMAEECFVRGLEDSAKSNRVFKEWARSWARRMIIQNAIRLIRPRSTDKHVSNPDHSGEPIQVATIVELPAFERFVLVMTMLERYSNRECALLLGSTAGEVAAARSRALQQIGKTAEHSPAGACSNQQTRREDVASTLQLEALSPTPALA